MEMAKGVKQWFWELMGYCKYCGGNLSSWSWYKHYCNDCGKVQE